MDVFYQKSFARSKEPAFAAASETRIFTDLAPGRTPDRSVEVNSHLDRDDMAIEAPGLPSRLQCLSAADASAKKPASPEETPWSRSASHSFRRHGESLPFARLRPRRTCGSSAKSRTPAATMPLRSSVESTATPIAAFSPASR